MPNTKNRTLQPGPRALAVVGLLCCALGGAVLWSSGADFPVAIPPGGDNSTSQARSEIVFLTIAAIVVTFVRWRWTPLLATLLGLLFAGGFAAAAADGAANLAGRAGAAVALGQAIQVAGWLIAAVAGVLAVRSGGRKAPGPPE